MKALTELNRKKFVNTLPPNQVVAPAEGLVFYDGECSLCLTSIERFGPLLRRHHFQPVPLQADWVQKRLGLDPGEPLVEMKLLASDGRIYGGADALLQIARNIWWAWPLFVLAKIPGMTPLFHIFYRWIAANRTCLGNACQLHRRK